MSIPMARLIRLPPCQPGRGRRLLRCGAECHVTSRFVSDAALRFSMEPDYGAWRGAQLPPPPRTPTPPKSVLVSSIIPNALFYPETDVLSF